MDQYQVLLTLVRLLSEYLQRVPYWWKLPIVLMMLYQFRQREYLMQNNLFDSYSLESTVPEYDCQDPVIGHVSLGCFYNKRCTPLPYLYERKGITLNECVQHCQDLKYPYAGFDKCSKCFCGNDYKTYAKTRIERCAKKPSKFKCDRLKPGCGPASLIEVFRTMYCTADMKYARTHDGTCNDLIIPASGSRFYRFGRNVNRSKTFEDKQLLDPNPREISLKLMARKSFIPAKQLNMLAAGWIQFNLHDWFDHGAPDTKHRIYVPLSRDDPANRYHRGGAMKIPRTKPDNCKDHANPGEPATYQNDVTHWWDGSQLYGSDEETSAKLRSFAHGKLKVSEKDGLLPIDPKTGIDQTGFNNNWWAGLSLLHNIFTREHNVICDMLAEQHADWSDQKLYDTARLINTAVIIKIHTLEWTPAILNNSALRAGMNVNFGLSPGREVYEWLIAHNISIDAIGSILQPLVGNPSEFNNVPFSLTEEFVSVYRMHPLLPDELHMRSVESGKMNGLSYTLKDYSFDKARNVMTQSSLGDVLYTFGVEHPGALTLNNYPQELMNLKLPRHQQNGETIDLATIDILRDRERGIPRYNEFRRLTNLAPVDSFEKLTPNEEHVKMLKEIYNDDIEKLDMLIGSLAEQPRPDGFGFGETPFNIFVLMASRRLKTDRFMTDDYNPEIYTPEGFKWIQEADMRKVLIRAFPEVLCLSDILKDVKNAFFPWNV